MNSARKRGIHILVAVFVTAIMTVAMVTPVFAQQGPEIRLTYVDDYADVPDVAIDSNGNVHIAFEVNDGKSGWGEIWYTMLDNDGSTLIDDTVIDDDNTERKPAIGVDSQDRVHIVWQSNSGDDIAYIQIDPYLDDMDGHAATLADITLVAKTILYSNDHQQDPRIAIDSNDNVHVVWENYDDYGIAYMQLNSGGGVVVPYTVVADTNSDSQRRPFVAVDSNDDPHIVWNDDMGTSKDEIFYAMLSGVDGSHLIGATLITPDDEENSKRSDIVVDDEDMVHIFWSDGRAEYEYAEIYYTKLDPSLHDQDGDPAVESAITVIDDTRLTTYDGKSSSCPQAAFQCGYIHVTWKDARWGGDPPEDVFYMVLDTDGTVEVPETALTTGSTLTYTHYYADNVIPVAVDSSGKAHAAWCDDRTENPEIWYTSYQGPACPTPTPPPSAEFSATPTTGPTPLEVQFTDESAGDFDTWSWDFGDGDTSDEQNPVHIYTHPGPFTVSLGVSGPSGNFTATKIDYIHPYTMRVGGEAYPVSKVSLLAPWLGLALLLAAGGGILTMRRRRAN